jgi:hypothetical protein
MSDKSPTKANRIGTTVVGPSITHVRPPPSHHAPVFLGVVMNVINIGDPSRWF